jgi:fatty acid desaturase
MVWSMEEARNRISEINEQQRYIEYWTIILLSIYFLVLAFSSIMFPSPRFRVTLIIMASAYFLIFEIKHLNRAREKLRIVMYGLSRR